MKAVEVFSKREDARDAAAEAAIADFGIKAEMRVSDAYYMEGGLNDADVKEIAERLLADSLTQEYSTGTVAREGCWIIEARYKDNVSDPAQDSIIKAIKELGKDARAVRTARRYYIKAEIDAKQAEAICRKLFANAIVEDFFYGKEKLEAPAPRIAKGTSTAEISEIRILEAGDDELLRISREGVLSLSLEEMKAVKDYFKAAGRNPTDGELETIAQTWSEHCKHKTFNSEIEFESNGKKELIGNLFRETIVAATKKISEQKKWLVSVFKDNAGIIRLDENNNFAFKVETHNHPSALDPYGGASTGIGGVIRDVLGAGLGAKPIFNTDIFCFAPSNYSKEVPSGILHPKRIFRGVVEGVRDYGNRMGIPTVNGAIIFHDDYLGAPLVYCGTGGIIPRGMERKKASPGELIVVIGGKTGRDGLHGATFSSAILDESSSSSAVQIGNPIEEKKMMDVLLQARDQGLYTFVTDCGAGGFSSAVGEMAQDSGAEVHLEKAALKHGGMKPWEIWLSESQERMIIAVPEEKLGRLMKLCESEDVDAIVIGRITDSRRLVVMFNENKLVDLEMEFLHEGLPKMKRKAAWNEKIMEEPEIEEKQNYNDELKKILSHPTITSKEEVIRRYDHEVQGNTIGKPMIGIFNDGPSDAAIIRAGCNSDKAIVVSNGINPRYSAISSYWMAASAIDEALRNVVSSGGDIKTTALLDNFCWGSTAEEEKLGRLVMAAKACHDTAIIYETPFISGKDSLHNEFKSGNKTIAIPDTLLISAVSVIEAKSAITVDLKEEGSSIYIVGKTYDELGGSYYYDLFGEIGGNVPKVRAKDAKKSMETLTAAMRRGVVLSCHDCSEGGLAVAAAEMAFAGNIGMRINCENVPNETDKSHKLLFSESNSRFIVEVARGKEEEFEKITGAARIGETIAEKKLIISKGGSKLIDADIDELKKVWKGTIRW